MPASATPSYPTPEPGRLRARIERQKRTVGIILRAWCRLEHGRKRDLRERSGGLCAECRALLAYAQEKLDRCPFGEAKPFCSACRVHCYGKAEREAIRRVMRRVGPRMLWLMPLQFVEHVLRGAPPRGPR